MGLCICLQAERGIFDSLSYLKLFRRLSSPRSRLNKRSFLGSKKALYVLIPVLREQKIIEDTIIGFCKLQHPQFDIKVVVITTAREKKGISKNALTTKEVVIRSMRSGGLSPYKNSIQIFTESDSRGNMATQLNYAIKKLSAVASPTTFYMVYNADSVISETTVIELGNLIRKHRNINFALQSPCAFVRDMGPNSNRFTNALALYQSWYCLGHESRLLRAYEKKSLTTNLIQKLGVVVGHGSGMTLGLTMDNGGYPSDLLTEDLTFAFMLSARGVPIFSLPALELADVPDRFPMFIKQKSVWFWNFLGYGSCYKKARETGHSPRQLIPLLIQGISWGAYWFFDTFFIVIPIILSIVLGSCPLFIFSLATPFILYVLPEYILLKKLPQTLRAQGFQATATNVEGVSFASIMPTLCLIILTNSVGAWIATFKWARYLFTGRMPNKYKTGD